MVFSLFRLERWRWKTLCLTTPPYTPREITSDLDTHTHLHTFRIVLTHLNTFLHRVKLNLLHHTQMKKWWLFFLDNLCSEQSEKNTQTLKILKVGWCVVNRVNKSKRKQWLKVFFSFTQMHIYRIWNNSCTANSVEAQTGLLMRFLYTTALFFKSGVCFHSLAFYVTSLLKSFLFRVLLGIIFIFMFLGKAASKSTSSYYCV